MKMTLDQLKVDSYATQVSEIELTEIKGGTWLSCLEAAALVLALAADLHDYFCDGSGPGHLTPSIPTELIDAPMPGDEGNQYG
jgi:hypothetical protein